MLISMLMLQWILLLLLLSSSCLLTSVHGAVKDHHRLVVFAGPEMTSESGVEAFLYHNAPPERYIDDGASSSSSSSPLEEWVWPRIQDAVLSEETYQIYEQLVKNVDNKVVQDAILKDMQFEWDELSLEKHKGLVWGTAWLDKMGTTPYSHYGNNNINALDRVVDALELTQEPQVVTVIIFYQTPRLDQWLEFFNREVIETQPGESAYHDFICNSNLSDKRWETLDTSMNPLRMAEWYTARGYNVVMINLQGVQEQSKAVKGLDIHQVIACQVLEAAKCTSDGILQDYQPLGDEHLVEGMENVPHGLTRQEQDDLEKLFQARDCTYQDVLQNHPQVEWLYFNDDDDDDNSLWSTCQDIHKDVPALLNNTDWMWQAMQTQMECSEKKNSPVDITLLLAGKYKEGKSSSSSKWKIPVFLLLFVVLGAVALVWTHKSANRNNPNNNQNIQYHTRPTIEMDTQSTTTITINTSLSGRNSNANIGSNRNNIAATSLSQIT